MRKARKMKQLRLYAKQNHIVIDENCPPSLTGIAVQLPKTHKKVVSIAKTDASIYPRTRLEVLAHELGHCATNTFYDRTTATARRLFCERTADLWAITFLMSPQEIESAINEKEQCAEKLGNQIGVSVGFTEKAIKAYQDGEYGAFVNMIRS